MTSSRAGTIAPFHKPTNIGKLFLAKSLMILSTTFQTYLQGKMTCRHLWLRMMAFHLEGHLSCHRLDGLRQRRLQIRLL